MRGHALIFANNAGLNAISPIAPAITFGTFSVASFTYDMSV